MSALFARLRGQRGEFQLDLDLDLPGDGICALFGPSGSGKSLALRCLAGVERLADSEVRCGDEVWQAGRRFLPPAQRRIGWLPQAQHLFTHLDVAGNLDFALQRRRADGPDRAAIIDQTGIGDLLRRAVGTLSGGERQRVALARCLLSAPRWLLLDEPLSALDQPARHGLVALLRRLQRELALPMLLVSHAADEVERLADRVVTLSGGRGALLRSLGEALLDPGCVLHQEAGPAVVFDLLPHAVQTEPGLLGLDLDGGTLWVAAGSAAARGPQRVRIAARDVTLWLQPPPPSSAQNLLPLQVLALEAEPAGSWRVSGRTLGDRPLHARISAAAQRQLQIAVGDRIHAQFKATALGEA